jgi:hypothetical protein
MLKLAFSVEKGLCLSNVLFPLNNHITYRPKQSQFAAPTIELSFRTVLDVVITLDFKYSHKLCHKVITLNGTYCNINKN